jgi:phospholipase/carboxylesterase
MMGKLNAARRGAPRGQAKRAVVFVHGYGADGSDLLSLADPLAPHLPDCAFYAPDAPQPCAGNPFGRQWFGIPRFDGSTPAQAKAGLDSAAHDLNGCIGQILVDEGLADKDLILLGFSQGAMMSLHVAPRRAAALAGVVAISGKLIEPNALPREVKVKPEVLLIHGDADDVVPFAEMQAASAGLIAAGFAPQTHVMRHMGHGISQDGLQVALAFMARQFGLS